MGGFRGSEIGGFSSLRTDDFSGSGIGGFGGLVIDGF